MSFELSHALGSFFNFLGLAPITEIGSKGIFACFEMYKFIPSALAALRCEWKLRFKPLKSINDFS